MNTFQLDLNEYGVGEIALDGVVLGGIRAVTLTAGVGIETTVLLELVILDSSSISLTRPDILIPQETGEVLVALGWTPPPAEVEDDEPVLTEGELEPPPRPRPPNMRLRTPGETARAT